MRTDIGQDDIQTLRERVQYLENINRITVDALDTAASLGDFQKSINNLADQSSILEETRKRILKLLPLDATAFFLIDESNSEFYLSTCTPHEYSGRIQKEIDQAIENGTFAWALREKRPVIVSTKDFKGRLILHLITTASRSRGMFVGIFSGDEKDIPYVSLSLLSMVLLNSANALESMELYSMIRKINANLEKIVAQRTQELTYRLEFENLVATLSTTFINLSVDDIDNGIQNALATIGRFVGADYGFVCVKADGIKASKEYYQWHMAAGNRSADPSIESYPYFRQCLDTGTRIYFSAGTGIRDDARQWQGRTIQSMILVPMMKGGVATGVLGFDSVAGKENWTEETASEIKIVADMLMNALERKWSERERKALEVQLQHTHKMKGIGTLAAGVAHELNQPLMVIRTFVQMLSRKMGKDTEYSEEIMMMEKNTGRMKNIIDHLRDFSRQTPSEVKPVDVSALVEDAFQLFNEQLRRRHIDVEKELTAGLPQVMGSINQLEQVLVNLVTNAMDAVSDAPENDVRKDHPEKGDPDHRNGRLKIATRLSNDAEHVEIRVSDNGNGIHEDALSRIFDPFFTTKDVGQGTGLGLSISYGIMKEHGGSIEVAETGPGGSTFSMKLRAAPSTPLLS